MDRNTRTPVRALDRDGQQIVLVPLANHDAPAKLLSEDWDYLGRQGISTQWTYNDNNRNRQYVRCPMRRQGNLETVARLITGAERGDVVSYLDGDRLNLRRDNLRVRAVRLRRHPAQPAHG